MTLKADPASFTDTLETDDAEKTMRRALGLDRSSVQPRRAPADLQLSGDRAHHQSKRRFIRDGEVRVVVLNGRDAEHGDNAPGLGGNRLEIAEMALSSERAARRDAERSLAEAQTQTRELQTRLGHIRLSGDETRDAALRAEREKQSALVLLQDEQAAHRDTCEHLRQAHAASAVLEKKLQALQAARSADIAAPSPAAVTPRISRATGQMVPNAKPGPPLADTIASLPSAPAKPRKANSAVPQPRTAKVAHAPKAPSQSAPKAVKWWIKPKVNIKGR